MSVTSVDVFAVLRLDLSAISPLTDIILTEQSSSFMMDSNSNNNNVPLTAIYSTFTFTFNSEL